MDSWILLPKTAASDSQPAVPEPLSPMAILSPATIHGFQQHDDEHEIEFGLADSALRSEQVSISNDPSLESTIPACKPLPDATLGKSSTA
jgi:hypothetical protein